MGCGRLALTWEDMHAIGVATGQEGRWLDVTGELQMVTWTNLTPTYTEQQGSIVLGGDLVLTAGNYGTGYVEFKIANS